MLVLSRRCFSVGARPNSWLDKICERYKPPAHYPYLTLPTAMTLARVVTLPLFVGSYYLLPTSVTCAFFLASSLTDYADGYLARRLKLESQLGATLDPVADKMQVCTTLTLLASTYASPLVCIPAVAIVSRELAVSGMREHAASEGEQLSVSSMGKTKTAMQFLALFTLLAAKEDDTDSPTVALGEVLLWSSAGLTILSGAQYGKRFISILDKGSKVVTSKR